MNKYFVIKQINDRKNEGERIPATFIGTKIGFPVKDLGNYFGLFRADTVQEREKSFKIDGEPIDDGLPTFHEFMKYALDHAIGSIDKVYSYLNRILIIKCPGDDAIYFITKVDGEIVDVVPFSYKYINRYGKTCLEYNVTLESPYLEAFNILRYKGPRMSADDYIPKLINTTDRVTDKFRYYPTFNIIVGYSVPSWSSPNSYIYRIWCFENNEVCGIYLTVPAWVSDALKKETEYVDHPMSELKDFMKSNYIGAPSYSCSNTVGYEYIECATNKLRVYMFNFRTYSPAEITEEEAALVNKSKEEVAQFRKYAAKNLGLKGYLQIASKLTDEAILRLDRIV